MNSGVGTVWLMLLPALMLAGCRSPSTDEEQILGRIEAMTEAIEEGNVRAFMRPVAEDFIAARGGMDRSGLRALVMRERLAREAIRVRRTNTRVEFSSADRAGVSFHVLATGGSGLLPEEGRLWRIETGWRRDDGDWMLISAAWEPVAGRLQ